MRRVQWRCQIIQFQHRYAAFDVGRRFTFRALSHTAINAISATRLSVSSKKKAQRMKRRACKFWLINKLLL